MHIAIEKGNIFDAESNHIFVHCVAADIVSNPKSGTQGIAKPLQDKFLYKENIKMNRMVPDVGCCMYTEGIYHLVTKPTYYSKPTNTTMRDALFNLRSLCIKRRTMHLVMPKIGCGLDKLIWDDVYDMICEVFIDTDISITVYTPVKRV